VSEDLFDLTVKIVLLNDNAVISLRQVVNS